MPTILELFRGSTFDTDVDSKSQEGKGTTFSQIKSFAEQETTGVRVKSAVELNNPLIYGNEATRIALRSTPDMDKMRTDEGDGGLIGGTITKVRDKVNSKLKVPQTLIPSSYTKTTQDKTLNDPELGVQSGYLNRITEIKDGGEGSFIGGLLSGGNPKTIAKQAAGNLLKEAKGKVRDALFKNNPFAKEKPEKKGIQSTAEFDSFSLQNDDNKNIYESTSEKNDSYSQQSLKNIEETGTDSGKFGILNLYKGNEDTIKQLRVGRGYTNPSGKMKEGINPKTKFEGVEPLDADFKADDKKYNQGKIAEVFETKGFRNDADKINQSGIYKEEGMNDDVTKLNNGEFDFVPLKFKNVKTNEVTNFRGTITGLSETISPSWDSAKFSGNPFDFYTYTGVSRNVTFNFTVYPMNAYELVNNWTKLGFLTSLCYPLAYQGGDLGSVSAPFIFFTLGDMYKDRFSYIDSLQYTIPDNSNWQMDADVAGYDPKLADDGSGRYFSKFGVNNPIKPNKNHKLPHLIEVAITIQLVEARANTEDRGKLYSFKPNTY